MGKKRDRRVGLNSARSTERVESSTGEFKKTDSENRLRNKKRKRTAVIFALLFIVAPAVSAVIYSIFQAPNAGSKSNLPYVYERGLVKTEVNYRQILAEHTKVSENVSRRQFQNPVLAYITPWNSKGYDLAKKFHSKLTHISPVWYDLKSQGNNLILEGRHNADKGWISELRMKGNVKILPRVVLEAIPMDLLKKKKQRDKAINIIITECREMDYDGIVLESWSRWATYGILHDPQMRIKALQFIKQLGEAMHAVSLEGNKQKRFELVYVIGPSYSDTLQPHDFGPEDLSNVGDIVDGFSLMTYDFSLPHNPGPNAPLMWIRSTLRFLLGSNNKDRGLAEKIFVGINFYGNDFELSGEMGGGPILGSDYVSLLEKHGPVIQWEKKSAEHFFLYLDNKDAKHVVFYPSLKSISVRLEEARSWGAAISIWEIGQVVQNYAMEALNAVGLTPISVLSDRRTEQRKNLGFHSFPQFKNYPNFTTNSLNLEEGISRSLRGGLAFLSTVLGTGLAKALTYEEALEQAASTAAPTTVDFDAAGVLDSISSFIGENPVVIGGGAVAIVAVPLVISQLLSKPKPWGVESAKTAYAKLSDDAGAQLLDIRPPSELRQVGSPDIRGLKKKPLTIPYKGEDKPGFLKKLSLKIKEPENTTLFVLDKFDGNSELVAELVTANGFKAAYAIRDGAEGSRGWMNSSLPWILPKKSLGLDLGNLTDAIGEGIDSASVALGLAAATGVGLLVFSEAETVLQLLGSAALVQVFSKKLLFAEDRKRTLQQIDEFLQTKVAPEELVDDVKEIGKALLPPTVTSSKALPAATVSSPSSSVPIAESVPQVTDNAPSKAEAVVEPTPDINSVPKAEVEAESVPGIPRPLSPYPNYPDFKPPTSPMPSQP